ncbi:MAG: nucleotidyltransferase domain-containing protein [Oscillospiraceae bacterium]|jgi:predicted nucleotidyltransferase|nr:nucleotidyltransferase domain-containing protein [Oscillospiraceae bacterium]
MLSLQEIKNGVAAAAREFPIKKAELFGSYANGSNTPDSDVDLLVEFTVPRISLITLNQMKYRLEEILQTDVDVIHGPLTDGCMIEIDHRITLYGA